MKWEYPMWRITEGMPLRTGQIMIDGERIVQTYPDNDGGYWYYHPETGEVVRVEE